MKIFISHSSKDSSAATAICENLESRGVRCWLAPRDVPPGHHYDEEIIDAIDQCGVVLVLLSRHSNESRHVKHEIERAVRVDKPIIPARLEEVDPSKKIALHISTRQAIDINLAQLDSSMEAVLLALQQFQNAEEEITVSYDATESMPSDTAMQSSGQAIWTRPKGWELRLLLEEVCCNLCRFKHAQALGLEPGSISINQEVCLSPGVFADIRVQVPDQTHYYLEVKYGYTGDEILECLVRKYHGSHLEPSETTKVILVVDNECCEDHESFRQQIQAALGDAIQLELWDEGVLCGEVARLFGTELERIDEDSVEELRVALENAKGRFAFAEEWSGNLVHSSLMWHLGFWRIKQLRDCGEDVDALLQTGRYPEVVILIIDLSCFNSYVRDTRDPDVIHAALTSFYTYSRYAILNSGGLLYQIVGDQIMALYGMPDRQGDYLQAALDCTGTLADVGNSVSSEWQQQIDRVQASAGVHIGMALGDIEVVCMRPFARVRFGLVGDCINIAHRLRAAAKSGEVVINNDYFRRLDPVSREKFQEIDAVNTKNAGKVRAFKTTL